MRRLAVTAQRTKALLKDEAEASSALVVDGIDALLRGHV